jgi:gas vesicle protein
MDGELLRTLNVFVKKGMNRTTWDLDRKSERMPSRPKPEPGAPEPANWNVTPGTYKVRLSYLKHMDSATVNVKADPRLAFTEQEMLANTVFFDTLYRRVRTATQAADRLRDAKKTIEQIAGLVKERSDSTAKKVKEIGTALQDSIKTLTELIDDREVQGIRNDPSLLENRLRSAMSYAGASWYPPGETERTALQQAVVSLKKLADSINLFFERDWPKYKDAVDAAKIVFFEPYVPIKIDQ